MKNRPMEEDEVAKAVKKKMMAKKNSAETKKTCICAPTNHAGSFRCHLHRMSSRAATVQKPSSWVEESKVEKNSKKFMNHLGDVHCNVGDNNNNGQATRISRFGRSASARTTSTNSHHLRSPLAMATAKAKKENETK